MGLEFTQAGYAAGIIYFRNDYKIKSSPVLTLLAMPLAATIFYVGKMATRRCWKDWQVT